MDDWFQMHNLLNEQIPDDDEPADHDFDVISQTGCDYEDNSKGLQLDVDKIIGSTQEEVTNTYYFSPIIWLNCRIISMPTHGAMTMLVWWTMEIIQHFDVST